MLSNFIRSISTNAKSEETGQTISGQQGSGQQGSGQQGSGQQGKIIGQKPEGVEAPLTEEDIREQKEALNKVLKNGILPELTPDQQNRDTTPIPTGIVSDAIDRLNKTVDPDIVRGVSTGFTVAGWKRQLMRVLANCMGIKEVWDNNIPNARLRGVFGDEKEVPELTRLVIALDVSASMGPDKFRKAIAEIEIISKALSLKRVEVWVFYWGDNTVLFKTKGCAGLYQKVASNSVRGGGTNFNQAVEFAAKKLHNKFDVFIVMTDGEFYETPTPAAVAFVRRFKSKFVWVLTPDGVVTAIQKYDPASKKRLVKQN